MHIQVAAAKIGKYAAGESGDTLEMVERPHGGLSFVLADGQRSGAAARAISGMVTGKAVALLADGIRDGAAARATHDYLFTQRRGKVSATLNIASVDTLTKTLVLSRNSPCPVVLQMSIREQVILDAPTLPIGVHRGTKPQIKEVPLRGGLVAVIYTDGLQTAGERSSDLLDVPAYVADLYYRTIDQPLVAQPMADELLAEAVRRDGGRPQDDMAVLVIAVLDTPSDDVRRLTVSFPIPPVLRP